MSKNILPMHQRGRIRTGLMNVINENGRIIYVAPTQFQVNEEFEKLFSDIDLLLTKELNEVEIFYYAASIHLVFAKIHPMNAGNGRSARLLEKWFLVEKFGNDSFVIPLEKNYFQNILKYYEELQKTGLEYDFTDFSKALSFLLMTVQCLDK